MTPPIVYVVQDQKWVDPDDGKLKPKFDFSPAERLGQLHFLLGSSASPFNLDPVLRDLHEGLENYRSDVDFLLLTGNPVLMGLATAIAADFSMDNSVRLLQWSGAKRDYIPVHAQGVFFEGDEDESDCETVG